jgi:hypothetical protein
MDLKTVLLEGVKIATITPIVAKASKRAGSFSLNAFKFNIIQIDDLSSTGNQYKIVPTIVKGRPRIEKGSISTKAMLGRLTCDDWFEVYKRYENNVVTMVNNSSIDGTLRKLASVHKDDYMIRFCRAVQHYISTIVGKDLTCLNADEVIDVVASILDNIIDIPVSDLSMIAISDNFESTVEVYALGGCPGEYYDTTSHVMDIDDDISVYATDVVPNKNSKSGFAPAPLSQGVVSLCTKEPSLVVAWKDPNSKDDIQSVMPVSKILPASREIYMSYMSKSGIDTHECSEMPLTFYKHTHLANHVIALPNVVRDYSYNDREGLKQMITLTPIINEFIRKVVRHMRMLSKKDSTGHAPFDVILPIDPIMTIGKSMRSLPIKTQKIVSKFCFMALCMYGNGELPLPLYKFLHDNQDGISDLVRISYIIYNINDWISESVCSTLWHPIFMISSHMKGLYVGSRFSGAETVMVCSKPVSLVASICETPVDIPDVATGEVSWADIDEEDSIKVVSGVVHPSRENRIRDKPAGKDRGKSKGKGKGKGPIRPKRNNKGKGKGKAVKAEPVGAKE